MSCCICNISCSSMFVVQPGVHACSGGDSRCCCMHIYIWLLAQLVRYIDDPTQTRQDLRNRKYMKMRGWEWDRLLALRCIAWHTYSTSTFNSLYIYLLGYHACMRVSWTGREEDSVRLTCRLLRWGFGNRNNGLHMTKGIIGHYILSFYKIHSMWERRIPAQALQNLYIYPSQFIGIEILVK